ncbi:hypothetical protein [Algoriphagus sp.]|uniref:3D domain-containing protein n=1 Tax=Algoriphagus sp. TaxID=1872435 RepID=UPI0025D8F845|nr:hypothetical protein [Algoriphagus sp.]
MLEKINNYLIVISIFLLVGCSGPETKTMKVTATAYNSVKAQTSNEPNNAAFGDTLKPGMKVIAISRDLLDSGFYHNMEVTIEGLEGTYKVVDLMNRRWTKKIDIYMGTDISKARDWGKQKVEIRWIPNEKNSQ